MVVDVMERRSALRSERSRVVAVLGPTNTGKTHLAMERLLGHPTGMIGFPLRLLARENYDRAVHIKGADAVALITGEEKIVPANARYFVCTVESMPLSRQVSFLAIDEIQLCADPDRGHVFTDRLLHARGQEETMFMGAETIRPLLRSLVPAADIVSRPRFSTLSYAGPGKLSRLPPRSAIVAFSVADVYAIAELIRRERGGTAIVLGALSPRTRNSQVALYQEGEVDYLVATDAIGMGLNMLIDHVAFAATRKFDGRSLRDLAPAELAQIAGRAGRYTRDGTFGCTAEVGGLDVDVVDRIENHRFDVLEQIFWRNSELSFASLQALKASLSRLPARRGLVKARPADDEMALAALERDAEIAKIAHGSTAVRLLWDVCQIPDFGKVMSDAHARLLSAVYRFLMGVGGARAGRLPEDWVARQVERINRTDGDIDALMQRLANIRIWTYVSHRGDWLDDPATWQQRTREIEDALSDAVHDRLIQRFVDRRTTSLYGRIRKRQELMAAITAQGEVLVEGHYVGTLEGFRFALDPTVAGADPGAAGRTVTAAALRALRGEIAARVGRLERSEDDAFRLDEEGVISWHGAAVGRLAAGREPLRPRIEAVPSELIEPAQRERLRRRLARFLTARLQRDLAPLFACFDDAPSASVRGLLFRLSEGLGCVPRTAARDQIAALGREDRRYLRTLGLRLGRRSVYLAPLLKPRPMALRALLWAVFRRRPPRPRLWGSMSMPLERHDDRALLMAMGYEALGPRAVRVDIVERLGLMAERLSRRDERVAPRTMTSIVGCTLGELPDVLAALGFEVVAGPEDDGLRVRATRRRAPRSKRKQRRRNAAGADAPLDPASPFAELRRLRSSA
jgi:ATP-dependent RNA helicase SUPV3L1/SUV3